MSIIRPETSSASDPRPADTQYCTMPVPMLDAIDHVQGVLIRWRKGVISRRDLQTIAERLGPVITHVGRACSGLDPIDPPEDEQRWQREVEAADGA